MSDQTPEGSSPPLVHGGLYRDPNLVRRLGDRVGSVRTESGVDPHWDQAIAPPTFLPHLTPPPAAEPEQAQLVEQVPLVRPSVRVVPTAPPRAIAMPPAPELVPVAPPGPVEPLEGPEAPTPPVAPAEAPQAVLEPPAEPVITPGPPPSPPDAPSWADDGDWDQGQYDQYWGIEPGSP